jgi:hypothetical protein
MDLRRACDYSTAVRAVLLCIGMCAAIVAAGCNCGNDPGERDAGADGGGTTDAGPADGGGDAGRDAGQAGEDRSSSFVSGGGASASSLRYRLRYSVGAPQPAGEAGGSGGRIVLGPAASPE